MGEVGIGCANLIEDNGKFLLVKEGEEFKRGERTKGQYNFPAGALEKGETLTEGAVREVKEETGLKVEPKSLIGIYEDTNKGGKVNLCVFVFESEVMGGERETSEKHPEVKYFSWEEIKDLEKRELLRHPYIINALRDYRKGQEFDLSVIEVLE